MGKNGEKVGEDGDADFCLLVGSGGVLRSWQQDRGVFSCQNIFASSENGKQPWNDRNEKEKINENLFSGKFPYFCRSSSSFAADSNRHSVLMPQRLQRRANGNLPSLSLCVSAADDGAPRQFFYAPDFFFKISFSVSIGAYCGKYCEKGAKV